jgi:hypothetical protein
VESVFARYVALGYTLSAAYKAARPEVVHHSASAIYSKASRMGQLPRVRDKIKEIQALADQSTAISLAGVSERIDKDWELAHATGNAGAAVSATKLKAQLHKHLERESSAGDVLKDVVSLIDGLDRLTKSRADPPMVDVTPDKPTDSR